MSGAAGCAAFLIMHPIKVAMPSTVSIIVLNWNGLQVTRACCASLSKLTYPAVRVYVVDNASEDGSAKTLPSEFPQFTHIANTENLGFTGGNNEAIRQAMKVGYDYILLLNNDTVVAPDFVDWLVARAARDP